MTDEKKFGLFMGIATALVAIILSYNILQEHFAPGLEGYVQRRMHYEKVISKKGLDLHKGMYWKEKE